MFSTALVLLALLPSAIPDPRQGSSPWVVVDLAQDSQPGPAAGYLVVIPQQTDQGWLERLVSLAAGGAPVVALGFSEQPTVFQHFDGVVVGAPEQVEALRRCCPGVVPVGLASHPAQALALVSWGVESFLIPGEAPWSGYLVGLYPEAPAARWQGEALPTVGRQEDLALLVGLPPGFAGGQVLLPSTWVASSATLVAQASTTPLVVTVRGEEATVEVPSLPGGGVLVVPRPLPAGGVERVEVTERRALTVGEILARHHRQVALQQRVLANFQAWQRLLVRVRVGELDRSVELLLAGPVFYTPELGRDWELREAWVNGAVWPVGALPELPLLQPKAPPVPPLTLELSPTYRYQLLGRQPWGERWVFVLSFFSQGEAPRHWGRAFVDEQTFGLAGLEMFSEHPQGEVRRARSLTRNRLHWWDATPLWLPWQVEGDDLVAAFGGVATVHRQLTLEQWQINGEAMAERRAQAWRGSNPMLRERRGEVVPLEPDGVGGRREVSAQGRRQSFLLVGGAWDPEVGFPVPLLGYQRLDFAWHGRSQLRLFLAGAVNDLAWSRPGPWEAQVRAFLRLAPSSTAPYLGNRRRDQEALYLWRQRVRVGLARQWGAVRTAAEVGADVLHFSRTPDTHPTFRLPRQTLEPVVGVNLTWQRGELLLEGRWEMGQRQRWQTWGFGEHPRRRFSRGGLSMRFEHAPVPLVKVSLAADVAVSRNADRFSSYALGGWGGSFAGLPGGRVTTRDYASLRATLGLPWRRERRLELAGQWGWVRHPVTGQGALPLAGVAVGLTARGPWDTMLQASVGLPLVAPGPRQPLAQLLLLRPLGGKPRR